MSAPKLPDLSLLDFGDHIIEHGWQYEVGADGKGHYVLDEDGNHQRKTYKVPGRATHGQVLKATGAALRLAQKDDLSAQDYVVEVVRGIVGTDIAAAILSDPTETLDAALLVMNKLCYRYLRDDAPPFVQELATRA